jgi:hypothetical protein
LNCFLNHYKQDLVSLIQILDKFVNYCNHIASERLLRKLITPAFLLGSNAGQQINHVSDTTAQVRKPRDLELLESACQMLVIPPIFADNFAPRQMCVSRAVSNHPHFTDSRI